MKGFKNSTKTQSGHGYDEVPTRPATSKDVAAAKSARIITPGKPAAKPAPRVTTGMILGESEDRAPGERGGKKFAVGGMVPPRSGGMPALGKPLTAQNVNDGRLAPPRPAMPVAPKGPMIGKGGLPQAWRDNYAADSARRLGTNPQPLQRIVSSPDVKPNGPYSVGEEFQPRSPERTTGKPGERAALPSVPSPMSPERQASLSAGMSKLPTSKAYKAGGKVVEKGSKEVYASKAAMKKHEASESKAKERTEKKQDGGDLLAGRAQSLRDMASKPTGRAGYAKGGKSRWS